MGHRHESETSIELTISKDQSGYCFLSLNKVRVTLSLFFRLIGHAFYLVAEIGEIDKAFFILIEPFDLG